MKKTASFFMLCALCVTFATSCQAQKKKENNMVLIETSMGNIKVKLYDETVYHRDNFLKLAQEGYYDGTLFHRVISGFMIQGGDPDSRNAVAGSNLGVGGPGYTLPAEIIPKYYHKKGTLSAARTGDQMNPMRRSSGSQFFIVQGKTYSAAELSQMEQKMGTSFTEEQKKIYSTEGGTPFLDAQYTVFGEVTEGLDIVDKIAAVKTSGSDRPVEDVKIVKMSLVKE